jgi:hypothetical protein
VKAIKWLRVSNGWLHRVLVNQYKSSTALTRTLVAALVVMAIAGTTVGYGTYFSRVLWLDDIPVTSIGDKELGPAIHDWWDTYKGSSITVVVSDTPFDTTVEQLGYRVDIAATLEKVLGARRLRPWKLRQ